MQILVDPSADEYVREIVRQVPKEVGGIGYIELLEPSVFYIHEFVLLPQRSGQWSVEFEDKDYIEEITRAANEGKEEQLRLSWHSHRDMNVYFSDTDEQGVKEYASLGMPWFVSLVFNTKGEVACRVDSFDAECFDQITIRDDDAYEVDIPANTELIEEVKAEVKQKVKPPKPVIVKKGKGGNKDDKAISPLYSEQYGPMLGLGWNWDNEEVGEPGNAQDRQAWKEDDYENVAEEIIGNYSHGLSVPVDDDEEDEIKELMEKK